MKSRSPIVSNEAAIAVQAVFNGAAVEIHLSGRDPISSRKSIRFIADQALTLGRPGFAIDGQAEKFCVKGGLASDEIMSLFNEAREERAGIAFTALVREWGEGRFVSLPDDIAPEVKAVLMQPVSPRAVRALLAALPGQSVVARSTTPAQPSGNIGPERAGRRS